MSEQRDSEARGDDPLTCSKCGGPTKENGRWHPDIGAVYGYELGLAERDPAPDTPEVAERPEKCPTCGGAPDDPGYDEINAGDQTGRDYCPDPFHTPEDTSRVEEDEPIDLTTPVRTRARLAAWREVEGDISGYDSEGYQRMIDHWPVVDDPERLGEVDEGESRVETTSGIDAGPWQEHEGTRVAQAVIAEIDKAYARGYNDGVQLRLASRSLRTSPS